MKKRLHNIIPEYADVQCIGIPRGLLYYRYRTFWTEFFSELGVEVLLSRSTDRAIMERGEALCVDESCLASKIYMGHVESLIGKCDAIFVPSIASTEPLHTFCTKFQSLPDLVDNTFKGKVRVVSCMVNEVYAHINMKEAFAVLAMRFGASEAEALKLVHKAWKQQVKDDEKRAKEFDKQIKKIESAKEKGKKPLSILIAAHPYVLNDKFMGEQIIDLVKEAGATPLIATDANASAAIEMSGEFSPTLPWEANRELVGTVLRYKDKVDGVILASSFPCGPDSMANDLLVRRLDDVPVLNLTIDAQSGNAGLETRVESFVDILRYQDQGGYL